MIKNYTKEQCMTDDNGNLCLMFDKDVNAEVEVYKGVGTDSFGKGTTRFTVPFVGAQTASPVGNNWHTVELVDDSKTTCKGRGFWQLVL